MRIRADIPLPPPSLPSVNPRNLPLLSDLLAKYIDKGGNIFRCPSDDSLFKTEKTSYFYYAELGQTKLEQCFFYKIFGDSSKVPILWDAANFHGTSLPYNWLFADGHVDQFIKKAQ
jgi:prepilin-type processing-associated H-X9-DG protein